jgi:hypothetical protein
MLDLNKLERLLSEATPVPWVAGWGGDPESEGKDGAGPYGIVAMGLGGVCEASPISAPAHASSWERVEANMNAIAALRNAAPSLLAAVQAGKRLAESVEALGEPENTGIPQSLIESLAAFLGTIREAI